MKMLLPVPMRSTILGGRVAPRALGSLPATGSTVHGRIVHLRVSVGAPNWMPVRRIGRHGSTSYTTNAHGSSSTDISGPESSMPPPPSPPLPPSPPSTSTGFLDNVVERLNMGIRQHPGETLAVLFASDIGSIGAMYGLLSISGIEFSPEFALAFAASRPFRRFRLPLDLAAAAAVAKLFPAFSRVRLSELTNIVPSAPKRPDPASPSVVAKSMEKVFNVVDSYGAAYMMGSRLMGVGVVTALYFLIKQGVDVMPLLAKLGVDEVGTALGSYAAAVVFSSAFYPVTLGITGYVVPVVAKARKTLMP